MAVILGRKKGKSIELSGNNGQIIYRLPLVYLVYDETGIQSEGTIISTAGLPLVNEPFTIDGVQFTIACKSKRAEQWDNNNKYWTVTCDCDNEPFETGGGGGGDKEGDQPDPTTWIPIVKLEYETIDWVVESDTNGKAIANFANRPYSTPLTRKKLIPCLKFTQYENPNQNIRNILARNETLNGVPYLGACKGAWMLTVEDSDLGYKNGYLCWRVDYKLRFNERIIPAFKDDGSNARTLDIFVYQNGFKGIGETDLVGPFVTDQDYGNVSSGTVAMSGWLPVIPQLDYLDIDNNPVVDEKGNQIFGMLNSDGTQVAPANQDKAYLLNHIAHEIYPYLNFPALLRINQEQ